MNASANTTRNRQITYAVAILLLFTAMYPYTEWLDRLKARKELGEATLGQIDTGSFMLKLALIGGFRGVAADVLWNRAIDLQKVHEWDRLEQTVNMITKLQPHFLAVWTYQGWNLSYNVAVEWDDPADKYEWIKRGIKFIQDGVGKNRKSPDLLWDSAWTYYHKIGFADEAIILRKLFREDDDEAFKVDPIELDDHGIKNPRHDNFLLAYGWFTRAVRMADREQRLGSGVQRDVQEIRTDLDYVDRPVQHKGRPDDIAFRTMPAHAQTRYAIGLEKESIKDYPAVFGDVARTAWEKAYEEWVLFGKRPWKAFSHPHLLVYLGDHANPAKMAELQKTSPPQFYWTERWSNQMNFRYWSARAQAEGEKSGVAARRLFYEGTKALKAADFPLAVGKYKQGLAIWKELLSRYPAYEEDEMNKKDTGELVKRYAFALKQLGEALPEDTPFFKIYKAIENEPSTPDPFDALDMIRTKKPSSRTGAAR